MFTDMRPSIVESVELAIPGTGVSTASTAPGKPDAMLSNYRNNIANGIPASLPLKASGERPKQAHWAILISQSPPQSTIRQ